MPGSWLASFARRLTRDASLERLVAPAIADLQSEAPGAFFIRTLWLDGGRQPLETY